MVPWGGLTASARFLPAQSSQALGAAQVQQSLTPTQTWMSQPERQQEPGTTHKWPEACHSGLSEAQQLCTAQSRGNIPKKHVDKNLQSEFS